MTNKLTMHANDCEAVLVMAENGLGVITPRKIFPVSREDAYLMH